MNKRKHLKQYCITIMIIIIISTVSIQGVRINNITNRNVYMKSSFPIRSSFYADNPECWLVLYNANYRSSVAWANWYQQQRNIPTENMLGLRTTNLEHLDTLEDVQNDILNPVRNYLNNHPQIRHRLIGFIVGYMLPGHYGTPYEGSDWPQIGGFSIANELQCLTIDRSMEFNYDCPKYVDISNTLPPERLNRATMTNDRYMSTRMDGPTIDSVKALTTRAKAIENDKTLLGYIWYDYTDSALPSSTWHWLKYGIDNTIPNTLPLLSFDADTEQTPYDAFRFGTHDINGWDDTRLDGRPAGPRILAYNLNSFGAITVRDIHDGEDYATGVYVPNAINAGYASAIGATGEPQYFSGPFPDVILSVMLEGWTLGEAFYLGNGYHNWFWEVNGDPFLALKNSNLTPPN